MQKNNWFLLQFTTFVLYFSVCINSCFQHLVWSLANVWRQAIIVFVVVAQVCLFSPSLNLGIAFSRLQSVALSWPDLLKVLTAESAMLCHFFLIPGIITHLLPDICYPRLPHPQTLLRHSCTLVLFLIILWRMFCYLMSEYW